MPTGASSEQSSISMIVSRSAGKSRAESERSIASALVTSFRAGTRSVTVGTVASSDESSAVEHEAAANANTSRRAVKQSRTNAAGKATTPNARLRRARSWQL